jgi:predicted Zn-dependent protease
MNIFSHPAVFRLRSLGFLMMLISVALSPICVASKTGSSQNSERSVIATHFEAAQQAQRNQDYIAAEREYMAVLAIKPDFAEVHMNLGLLYQLQDRIPDAMTEFRRALKLKPALTGANFFLGVDYCKSGEGAKAVSYLTAAAHAEPNRPDIWSWLATAYEMSGDINAEVATLREAIASQPRNLDLLYLLGHSYERLGKEEVKRLQKAAPGSARAEELLAQSYAASSEWPLAVIRFQNALAASPDIPAIRIELGETLLREGKVKRAREEFDEELRRFPDSLRALARRGEVKLVTGDLEGALLDWTRVLETNAQQAAKILGIREMGLGDAAFEQLPPDLREGVQRFVPVLQTRNTLAAHFALAFLAIQAGNTSAAADEWAQVITARVDSRDAQSCSEADLSRSLKEERYADLTRCGTHVLRPASPANFRILVAGASFEMGDYQASLEILSKLPPADRHSPEAAYWLARCYEKLATAAYLNLYEADPNSYRMHQLSGDLAAAKNDDSKAIEEYRAAVALKPALPNLHYSLGHVLWKDLKVNEARQEFEAELKLNSRHPGALNELGDTYLLEHQPEKALPLLERALAMDPANPDIHRDLGTAYSELQNYQRAAVEFNIAISADYDGSVHYKLARAYQALGEKEKASREFATSTALNQRSHSRLEKQTERMGEIEKWVHEP